MQEKRSRGGTLAAIIELSKLRITIAVTLSTLTGYVLHAGNFDMTAVWVSLGVFLLASSSSALNQYQERHTDALMTRTRRRPLPSGRLGSRQAFAVITTLFTGGFIILFLKTSALSLGLALLSFLWYNGIYTPLKYRTVYALIIGSVIGAIPPVIGWTASGGGVFASEVLFLAFFIYIWQVPHFILLLLLYGDDYKEAGLPVLTSYYDDFSVRKIIFVWILGTVIAGFMLPFMTGMNYWVYAVAVMISSLGLLVSMIRIVVRDRPFRVRRAFLIMNIFLVFVLLLVSADALH
jgi:protoheme IX farnesyltransferase